MWSKNKSLIEKAIMAIIAGAVSWGVAKTKITALEEKVSKLEPTVTDLRIKVGSLETELKDLKDDNKQEHRDIKRQIKGH